MKNKEIIRIAEYIRSRFPGVMAVIVAAIAMLGSREVKAQVNAEQCLTIGRNVLSMEDYMLSIQYFNQAIKAKPYLSDPYFFRGLAKLYLEDYKGAEDDCTAAIERNQYKTESYKVRGFARQYLGKDSLAIEDYKIGLSNNPQDKYFLFYKGVAETEVKRFDDADSTLNLLMRLYPKFDDGYSARARLRVLTGDTVRAVEDLDEAIRLGPTTVNPYLQRAEIESALKQWDKAAADMDEAIRLKPQEADLYLNRAYVRYNSDDFFGAMADYNYAIELSPYNTAALFNRALLRYEVRDLDRSAADLEEVLKMDPANFHARYNLGLVNLERGRYKDAMKDFGEIASKYPKFYPAYYAMAEARHKQGDMRGAMQYVHKAEDLVKKYVKNPEKNRLDRPQIMSGKTNTAGHEALADGEEGDEESEIEVMNRFNQLVTVSANSEVRLAYNEKTRGRVQDRSMEIDPEPVYMVSFYDSSRSLRPIGNFFLELDDFNTASYIKEKIFLTPDGEIPADEAEMQKVFDIAAYYRGLREEGRSRTADLLALGIAETLLKNYPAAVAVLNDAIASDPRLAISYMARAVARERAAKTAAMQSEEEEDAGKAQLRRVMLQKEIAGVLEDYDEALRLNPRLVYAWFNKGDLYYALKDYTSAMQCYSEALKIDPEFGQAYYNRGICYLQAGNKRQAFIDLSKAGEQGIVPAYSLLKRMKR